MGLNRRPTTLSALLHLKEAHPAAKLVVGNTEVGIEAKFKHAHYPVLVAVTHVPELTSIEVRSTVSCLFLPLRHLFASQEGECAAL